MLKQKLLFLSGFLLKDGMAYWPYAKINADAYNYDIEINTSNGIVNGTYTTTEPYYLASAYTRTSGYWIGYRFPWGEQCTWDGNEDPKWPSSDFLLPPGTQFICERSNYSFTHIYLNKPIWIEMPQLTTSG